MKNKNWQRFFNYIAFSLSMAMSPYVTALIFILAIVYRYSQSMAQFLPWVLTFAFFSLIIPGGYVLWLIETKKIQDIHINNWKERKMPFLIGGISAIIGALILSYLNAAQAVVTISVVYAVNTLAIAIITQFWKISVHTAMFSSICTMTLIIFGPQFWWMYLGLVPLSWARVYRRRHTIWQAITGAMVAFIFTAATFWAFGYF